MIMHFVTGSALAALALWCRAASSTSMFREILQSEIFSAHGLNKDDGSPLSYTTAVSKLQSETDAPVYYCGLLSEMKSKMEMVSQLSQSAAYKSHVVYVKKSLKRGCFVTQLSKDMVASEMESTKSSTWSMEHLPVSLKIHTSTLQYLSFISRKSSSPSNVEFVSKHKRRRSKADQIKQTSVMSMQEEIAKAAEGAVLTIEFLPSTVRETIRDVAQTLLRSLDNSADLLTAHTLFPHSPGLAIISARLINIGSGVGDIPSDIPHGLAVPNLLHCSLPASAEVTYNSMSADVSNLQSVSGACLLAFVQLAALSPHVVRVGITSRPQLTNYEARGVTQTGKMGGEVYRAAGMTGKGQVCGIADSGLNDLSCFFFDGPTSTHTSSPPHQPNTSLSPLHSTHALSAHRGVLTNRSGIIEPFRRKVIQYVAYADEMDGIDGHGTHVAGSVAGNSMGNFGDMDGMAPDAKISFFDIGVTGRDYLKIPELDKIFDTAYRAGARVHTNSWGNMGGIYGQLSMDVDKYLHQHEDFFVLFSAGNNGYNGLKSVSSPGNAKNCLTVGATQVRTVAQDESLNDQSSRLACFSSIGPTSDGRIKPDVVAPGDFIQSAWSGDPSLTLKALLEGKEWKGAPTCAVHQMSGTSMATPVTAGTALLVRQFFMEPEYWASVCNRDHFTCTRGAFVPSGYLLKAVFLHSGEAITRYSDPLYDLEPTRFPSFELLSEPVDVFQGHGEVRLSNVLPLKNGLGLDPRLDLFVLDKQRISEGETIRFEVKLPYHSSYLVSYGPMKITLCWYDPPAPLGSSRSLLMHDLDLMVTSPDGSLHWGNANRGQDFRSSSDVSAEAQRMTGDPFGSNSSYPGWAWADDTNPNEQVLIESPLCLGTRRGSGPCVFNVYVHANAIHASNDQTFALLITSSGIISGPYRDSKSSDSAIFKRTPKKSVPSPAVETFLAHTTNILATMSGAEITSKTATWDHMCHTLQSLTVTLNFTSSNSSPVKERPPGVIYDSHSTPSNMELTIVSPLGDAVSVGGADSSVGLAQVTTEWPDSWSRSRSGTYRAQMDVSLATLSGSGTWTVFIMNAWSLSERVEYDVSIGFRFSGRPDSKTGASCTPTMSPTPRDTSAPTASMAPTQSPTPVQVGNVRYVIPIPHITLGVHRYLDAFHAETFKLHEFNFTGRLKAIELNIDAYDRKAGTQTLGSNSWLLTVTVTDPKGLSAQVGGLQYHSKMDDFYLRRWPDIWIGRESEGQEWVGKRDVSAAGLRNSTVNPVHQTLASDQAECDFLNVTTGTSQNARCGARQKGSEWNQVQDPLQRLSLQGVTGNGTLGMWGVDLAMGYPWTVRSPVNFSGSVILHFTGTEQTGVMRVVPSHTRDTFDQDEIDAREKKKKKNDRDHVIPLGPKGKKDSRAKKLVAWILICVAITGVLFYSSVFRSTRHSDSRSVRRTVCRTLAVLFSSCECFRVLFVRNWYGFFGSRSSTRNKSREQDDEEESIDKNLLSTNTRHNSITTLNSITSHANLSFSERGHSMSSKSSSGFAAAEQEKRVRRARRGVDEVPYNVLEQEGGNEEGSDSDGEGEGESTFSQSTSQISLPSNSNSSPGAPPRKRYITWGTFTHLNAPSFFRSGSENSSLHSKSTASSDGGYGSVTSLSSVES